jgi:hypothetical protein
MKYSALYGKSASNKQASIHPLASGKKYEVTLLPSNRPVSQLRSSCVLLANASLDCPSNGRQKNISQALVGITSHPGTDVDPILVDRQPLVFRIVRTSGRLPTRPAIRRI